MRQEFVEAWDAQVKQHCAELWGLLCPDMGPQEFEDAIRALGRVKVVDDSATANG